MVRYWPVLGLCLWLCGLAPGAAHAQDALQVRMLSFPSGLRAILARPPASAALQGRVYVGGYIAFGTMEETELGQAHFIEHVVASSPPSVVGLPPPPAAMKSFNSNAATKPNYTAYLRVLSPDGLEASIYSRLARFGRTADNAKVFDTEKLRVVQELERGRGSARFSAYKALEAAAKGRSPRLDDEIAAVEATRRPAQRAVIERAYAPARSILVVTGDIDLDRTADMVRAAAHVLKLDAPSPVEPGFPKRRLDFTSKPFVLEQNAPGQTGAGVAFRQPRHDGPDYLAFLVLDQLLLGGRANPADPQDQTRSDAAPLPARLKVALSAGDFWDGKEKAWGVAAFAEGDPSLYDILFDLPAGTPPDVVLDRSRAALRDIRAHAMSDAEIAVARGALADFYRRWLLEPDMRILSDHLAAFAFAGRDPGGVRSLAADIAAVRPADVRRVMDRYLIGAPALTVVTGPRPTGATGASAPATRRSWKMRGRRRA